MPSTKTDGTSKMEGYKSWKHFVKIQLYFQTLKINPIPAGGGGQIDPTLVKLVKLTTPPRRIPSRDRAKAI